MSSSESSAPFAVSFVSSALLKGEFPAAKRLADDGRNGVFGGDLSWFGEIREAGAVAGGSNDLTGVTATSSFPLLMLLDVVVRRINYQLGEDVNWHFDAR